MNQLSTQEPPAVLSHMFKGLQTLVCKTLVQFMHLDNAQKACYSIKTESTQQKTKFPVMLTHLGLISFFSECPSFQFQISKMTKS